MPTCSPGRSSFYRRHRLIGGIASASILLIALAAWLSLSAPDSAPERRSSTADGKFNPPWIYGRSDARFTIVEYADLACTFCRAYFPVLRHWITEHPDVNWQWHHFPLSAHESAGMQAARRVECVGESAGNAAFWDAVAWAYQRTDPSGTGVLIDTRFPEQSAAIQACLRSHRPDAIIQTQIAEAARAEISATPTLRLVDQRTGQALVLRGPAEGDVLLSAIDWLMAQADVTDPTSK